MMPSPVDQPNDTTTPWVVRDATRLFHDLPFIGMAVTDPRSKRWLHVNQTLCDLMGYPHDVLVTKSWAELTHPEDLALDTAHFDRVMRGEADGYAMDKRFVRPDGTVVHASIDVKAIRTAEGAVEYFVATIADLSGRRAAEEKARDAASLLQNLVRQVPGVVYQYQLHPDGTSCFPFASEGLREIYEVNPEDVRTDASPVFARLHPDDLARVSTTIGTSANTLTPWHCTYRVRLPTRGVRWVRGDARPERLEDGSILWHGYIADVTEQESAREALLESEQRYRIQVEHAPEAIVVYDAEHGRYLDANANAEALFGRSRATLMASGLLDVTPAQQPDGKRSADAAREYFARTFAGESPVFEWVHLHVDGREIPCEVRLVALPFDGRPVVRASLTDISERRNLLQTLTRLDAAIASSLSGIAIADLGGTLSYVNQAFLRIWGFADAADVLGKPAVSFWASTADAQAAVEELLDAGRYAGELVARRIDGSERTLMLQASMFADPAGRPAGMLASFVDITEERRLQQQLLHSRKMESVGRLAGGIAHDFNNLLTVMKGYTELALEIMSPDDPLVSSLREVDRAADSAASLTQQLLAFSRKQIIAPRVLDLNDIVRRTEGMLRRLLGEHVTLDTVPAPHLGLVRIDPGQAEQILVNLAVNARDAMPDGGRLMIETANVELDNEYARAHPGAVPGAYTLLAVSDTGVGMSSETLAHAFEPFYTTKLPGHGTGLGLAMIEGAVSQNGGRVEVYSELGHGSTFKIYLPRVAHEESSEERDAGPEATRHGAESILVVEDDDHVRTLTIRLLRQFGYRAIGFGRGTDALEWLSSQREPVDLLLTDVIMPGLNGKLLAERVRALRPGMRVLYTSGYTANVIVQHGVLKPGIHFLPKPFSSASLSQRVREVLDAPSA